MTPVAADPAVFVSRIESLASRRRTRCGGGSMVWRVWGDVRPLVLLHGASGSWTHWIRNILPLAAHFRVFVPDMPGFGDSDTPPEPHTADALADVVAAGLEVLAPPPTKLDIAGFSFGGIIGGLVAARLGHRVRTLVLLGPGGMSLPHTPPPPLLRIGSDAAPADEIRRVHRENLRRLMIANPQKIDDLAVFVQMENIRRARFKSGSIPTSDALLRALPSIKARIAGIWGARDAFVGPYVQDRRRLLASFERNLDFRVIDGAGHWVTYEAADEVNAALLDVLREG
jgi:2-hydroxy-6-oxonona-2,4-dienedioate hydrolase